MDSIDKTETMWWTTTDKVEAQHKNRSEWTLHEKAAKLNEFCRDFGSCKSSQVAHAKNLTKVNMVKHAKK